MNATERNVENIVAIDLGKFNSAVCIFKKSTFKSNFRTIKTDGQEFHDLFVELDCFFCDRSIRKWVAKNDFEGETMPLVCDYCPGADVFVRFDCRQKGWHWKDNPLKFRAKLHRMNKKRIKK